MLQEFTLNNIRDANPTLIDVMKILVFCPDGLNRSVIEEIIEGESTDFNMLINSQVVYEVPDKVDNTPSINQTGLRYNGLLHNYLVSPL